MSAAANHLNRITVDPAINHGKPSIRGLRIPVQLIFELLASGMSFDEIIGDYPVLERDDVVAALGSTALVELRRGLLVLHTSSPRAT